LDDVALKMKEPISSFSDLLANASHDEEVLFVTMSKFVETDPLAPPGLS